MNNDLISRSALKKIIEDSVSQYGGQYSADMLNMWALFSHIVNDAPTVEPTEPTFREVVAYECGQKSVERPQGKLIIKNHMETCEKCGSVMPMMNDYYRAKLRGCPYCLTEFTNLAERQVDKTH